MMPAKQARKKMKIWNVFRPGATAGSVSCASAPDSDPPSHQSSIDCQYGFSTPKATLYWKFQIANPIRKYVDEADEEPDQLLDRAVELVDAAHAAHVDEQQPAQDRQRPDGPDRVDDVLRELVGRDLLREQLRLSQDAG